MTIVDGPVVLYCGEYTKAEGIVPCASPAPSWARWSAYTWHLMRRLVSLVVCLCFGCGGAETKGRAKCSGELDPKVKEMKKAFKAHFVTKWSEDYTLLAVGGDNDKAYSWLWEHPLQLVRAKDRNPCTLTDLRSKSVIFATPWDPYSAGKTGLLKKAIDRGEKKAFAIVYIEGTVDQVQATKGTSWFFENVYVIPHGGKAFTSLIGRVPFTVLVDEHGELQTVEEGV